MKAPGWGVGRGIRGLRPRALATGKRGNLGKLFFPPVRATLAAPPLFFPAHGLAEGVPARATCTPNVKPGHGRPARVGERAGNQGTARVSEGPHAHQEIWARARAEKVGGHTLRAPSGIGLPCAHPLHASPPSEGGPSDVVSKFCVRRKAERWEAGPSNQKKKAHLGKEGAKQRVKEDGTERHFNPAQEAGFFFL